MNKYYIDYTYGRADFFTEESDPTLVMREFYHHANSCFGIRKSISDPEILETYLDVVLPSPYQDKGGSHFLAFAGDEYLFDGNYKTHDGEPWKLYAVGNWCSCRKRGQEELSCTVHHFWVPDHSEICDCTKR